VILAADHVQGDPARGGLLGRPAQHAQPGRVNETDLGQVGHQRVTGRGQSRQLLFQLGHGGDVDLAGHADRDLPGSALDRHGQRQARDRPRPAASTRH
jgi:hypothetical protein